VCQYEIRGLEEPKVGRALGVDTLQALLMTIAAIQNQLRVYRNRLSWAGSDDGDDGLPYAMVFASPLNTQLCEALDSAIGRFELEMRRGNESRLKKRQAKTT
jgi:hypothetical protein